MRISLAKDRFDSEDSSNDWVIVTYRYHEPMMFQIYKDGTEIIPWFPSYIDPATSEPIDLTNHKATCGASIYDSVQDTIAIVLNKDPDCDILIKMISAIKMNMKFDLDYTEFFSNDYETTLTNEMAEFLGLPPERVRIVNIRQGSTIVDTIIYPLPPPEPITSIEDLAAENDASDQ